MSTVKSLIPVLRSSLLRKLERLLSTSVIATISPDRPEPNGEFQDAFFAAFASRLSGSSGSRREDLWVETEQEGKLRVGVAIDYSGRWDGGEKKVRQIMADAVDTPVYYLTDQDRRSLESDPLGFIQAQAQPETTDLLGFEPEESHGGHSCDRVIALLVSSRPRNTADVRHIAVVPNLVQLQRQLHALTILEAASNTGPIAPLRTLVGLNDGSMVVPTESSCSFPIEPLEDKDFDESQLACVSKAMNSPHFAVIKGPPGSGKTSVITSIVKRSIAEGQRVMIVSPTHIAVDNVVEKLTTPPRKKHDDSSQLNPDTLPDDLSTYSLPVRFATREKKVKDCARDYWVGRERQNRRATVARRVEAALRTNIPFAAQLFELTADDDTDDGPITSTFNSLDNVLCGTPIGLLSHTQVRDAEAGEFDVLIIDEVSKMTLPEFLAIAIKARRWVLVGDPEQLPPFNNCEENAHTLRDLLNPYVELVCSIGAILASQRSDLRRHLGFVVVTDRPDDVVAATRAHIRECDMFDAPRIATLSAGDNAGILVCTPADLDQARRRITEWTSRPERQMPKRFRQGSLLVQNNLTIPELLSEQELVEGGQRMGSRLFEVMYDTYHSLPWSRQAGIELSHNRERNWLAHYLPSTAALQAFCPNVSRDALLADLATYYAANAVSVFAWVTGISTEHFDVSPLQELAGLSPVALCRAVQPFIGTLTRQYRMEHVGLSAVPRELFYFGKALHDGPKVTTSGQPPVLLVQVDPPSDHRGEESNLAEIESIETSIRDIAAMPPTGATARPSIMVITPYSKQEEALKSRIESLKRLSTLAGVDISVCTLDSCQGKEADYVIISLVRGWASTFMNSPKRWNVAITRARKGLTFFGDIHAYLDEARKAIRDIRAMPRVGDRSFQGRGHIRRPEMSIPALLLDTYTNR